MCIFAGQTRAGGADGIHIAATEKVDQAHFYGDKLGFAAKWQGIYSGSGKHCADFP
ncbi:MAG: hypothetical protein AMXMBFR82_05290 [Candidatus Hydrogenedentota bacterium]